MTKRYVVLPGSGVVRQAGSCSPRTAIRSRRASAGGQEAGRTLFTPDAGNAIATKRNQHAIGTVASRSLPQ